MALFSLKNAFSTDKPWRSQSARQTASEGVEVEKRSSESVVIPSELLAPPHIGPPVNRRATESITAYYRAINFLADAIASTPIQVFEVNRNSEGRAIRRELFDHPISRVLSEPSQILSDFDLRHYLQEEVGYEGNAYAYIVRDGRGYATELIPLKRSECEPFRAPTGEFWYRVYSQYVGYKAVAPRDILHFAGPGIDPATRLGKSPMRVHADSMAEALTLREMGNAYYANGGNLAGWLGFDRDISKDLADKLRASWKAIYGGPRNSGSVAVIPEGGKYHPISNTARDAMYIEARRFSVEDISRITGVPLHKLSSLERATFNNIEHMSQEVITDTFLPIARRNEVELERKLLLPSEKGRIEIRYNLNSRMRADMKARAEYYTMMFNAGAYSPNDILEDENKNPRPDGDGYYVPMNLSRHDQPLPETEPQNPNSNA